MAKTTPDVIRQIEGYVRKYLDMLCLSCAMPIIKFRDNLGSNWLGRDEWTIKNPWTTTMTFQQRILADARTLERVTAHETIHHTDFLNLTASDIAIIRAGIRQDGHGRVFLAKAAKVNAVMGENFVTERSDSDYVYATNEKPFLILIRAGGNAWSWGQRISKESQSYVDYILSKGGKLMQVTDQKWTHAAKIRKGYSLPMNAVDREELLALYRAASAA